MTKLEQAARQALDALEVYGEHDKDCPQYPTYTRPQDYPKCDCGFDQAITALREALAEQAEQEPVTLPCCGYHDASAIMWNKFNGVVQCHNCGQIYAAPIRTKDLTVSELDAIIEKHYDDEMDLKAMILDGIAADREKNK